jgi:hypothetical protein
MLQIDPKSFSKDEPYICLVRTHSLNGKYGISDSMGHVICPDICEDIVFKMPSWLARINYKGLWFIMDRYNDYSTFLFFIEEWGIAYDLTKPIIITINSFDLFIEDNKMRKSDCNMTNEEMKAIYDDFTEVIKKHNAIITRSDILRNSDNTNEEFG